MKKLSKVHKIFIGAGGFFAVAMFAQFLLLNEGANTLFLAIMFFGCLLGGIFFAGSMYLFYMLFLRFGGARKIQPRIRTRAERVISFTSALVAAVPIFIVIQTNFNYLWPALGSGLVPYIIMLPLISEQPNNLKLALRTISSIVLTFILGVSLYFYFYNNGSFAINTEIMALAAFVSVCWCLSYFLSIFANRPKSNA